MFYDQYGRLPSIKEMGHFFPLYLHSEEELLTVGVDLNWSGDDENEILNSFLKAEHPFKDYEAFCKESLEQ